MKQPSINYDITAKAPYTKTIKLKVKINETHTIQHTNKQKFL